MGRLFVALSTNAAARQELIHCVAIVALVASARQGPASRLKPKSVAASKRRPSLPNQRYLVCAPSCRSVLSTRLLAAAKRPAPLARLEMWHRRQYGKNLPAVKWIGFGKPSERPAALAR